MRKLYLLAIGLLMLTHLACSKAPEFTERENSGKIENSDIEEASGLAASRKQQGVLWTHNDSGGDGVIFAVGTDGKDLGSFELKGANEDDWEDICIGPGPEEGVDYIYIANIGDNKAKSDVIFIYRLPVPTIRQDNEHKVKIEKYDTFTLEYPDGSRDAETLMIDPNTKDLYIVTKREEHVRCYVARYPQSTENKIKLEKVCTLTIGKGDFEGSGVNGGDISPDGREILIRDYSNVYYWYWPDGSSMADVLSKMPDVVDAYIYDIEKEPQGEAICWAPDGNGFYTTSEESPLKIEPKIYFYKRNR